jgi:transposase-like protein
VERLEAHPGRGTCASSQRGAPALLLRRGTTIEPGDLSFDPEPTPGQHEGMVPTGVFVPGLRLEEMLERAERQIIEAALRRFNNNRERVARELGVARSTLFKRLKDWGMTRHDGPPPAPRPEAQADAASSAQGLTAGTRPPGHGLQRERRPPAQQLQPPETAAGNRLRMRSIGPRSDAP